MVHLLCYDIGKGDRMSEMVKWINKHWRHINGYGSYIEGTWRRGDINESFTITDLNGEEVQIPPSTQWVHILPNEGEILIDN